MVARGKMPSYRALALALCCCAAGELASALETHEEALIGWKGETYSSLGKTKGMSSKEPWVQQISWRPRAYLYHNLLSAEEARHLRSVAAPQMKQSTVVGVNGSSVVDSDRTSYGTFIDRKHDATVVSIMSRVAEWTRVPTVHQEDLQVLRYGVGQKYDKHMDSLIDDSPRMATVLIYLVDTQEGGETAFPDGSEWINDEVREAQGDMSACTKGHVAVKPRLGDALLFFSIKPDGTHEPASMHTGCPVITGHKWTATVWVHSQPFRPRSFVAPKDPPPPDPALCLDASDKCAEWAKSGECEKNPVFMTGATGCRRSCKACEVCEKGDQKCWARNREKGGYLVYDTTTYY